MSLCEMYIEIGWCKRYLQPVDQYEEFFLKVLSVERNIKLVLKTIINGTPGLKTFMCIHSVFDQSIKRRWDWLVRFMAEELSVTDEDVKKVYEKEKIPDVIMKLFSKFNPKPISYEKYFYPNRIEYKLWGDYREGESTDPVNLIYTDWEEDLSERFNKEQVESFISKYDIIDI